MYVCVCVCVYIYILCARARMRVCTCMQLQQQEDCRAKQFIVCLKLVYLLPGNRYTDLGDTSTTTIETEQSLMT